MFCAKRFSNLKFLNYAQHGQMTHRKREREGEMAGQSKGAKGWLCAGLAGEQNPI